MLYYTKKGGLTMIFERTIKEIRGDYAVLVDESGVETEVALALLPDGVREGMVLICENFEYRIKSARAKKKTAKNSCPAYRRWTA